VLSFSIEDEQLSYNSRVVTDVEPPIDLHHSLVIYLHVPKAAGSTLENKLFKAEARKKGLFVNKHEEDFLNRTRDDQQRFSFIVGHRGYGVHQQPSFRVDGKKKLFYFTVVREPVSRVLSHYHYSKRAALENFGPNSTQYLQLKDLDLMSWFLTFRERFNSPWKADNNPNVFQFSRYWSPFNRTKVMTPMTRDDLERAKWNLSKFAVVGLTERFNETVSLITNLLGWGCDCHSNRTKSNSIQNSQNNSDSNRDSSGQNSCDLINELQKQSINRSPEQQRRLTTDDFPKEAIDAIRSNNNLDIELYEFATCLFERQLVQYNIIRSEDQKHTQATC